VSSYVRGERSFTNITGDAKVVEKLLACTWITTRVTTRNRANANLALSVPTSMDTRKKRGARGEYYRGSQLLKKRYKKRTPSCPRARRRRLVRGVSGAGTRLSHRRNGRRGTLNAFAEGRLVA
jgi:hypothetical protein